MTLLEFENLLLKSEDEHLEFKEAKQNFHFEKLVKYCAALANEGGGKMVLGVSDKPPRRVVGTEVFESLERTKAGLIERLHLRIGAEVLSHREWSGLDFPRTLAANRDAHCCRRGVLDAWRRRSCSDDP